MLQMYIMEKSSGYKNQQRLLRRQPGTVLVISLGFCRISLLKKSLFFVLQIKKSKRTLRNRTSQLGRVGESFNKKYVC